MRRHRTSAWLAAAVADGGLLIPGSPSTRSSDFRLAPDSASAAADEVSVMFGWDDYRVGSVARSASSWAISEWSTGRGGAIGVGVAVDGCYVESTKELRRRRRSLMNRVNRALQDGVVVPLCVVGHTSGVMDADRTMVALLCSVLAERPALRPRLGDSGRMRRLVAEMVSQPHHEVPFHMGGRRRTLEVLAALRTLGYEHRLGGRPLPDERIPSADELAPQVLAKIRANPYAESIDIDEAMVRDVINRTTWPLQPGRSPH